jgi:nucleoid DNA-binding protein
MKSKKQYIPSDELREYIKSLNQDYFSISDITPIVARNADVAHYKVEPIGAAFLRVIQALLIEGNTVVLHGVGTFSAKDVKSYWGKNPEGKKMSVRGHKRITFKTSKSVKAGLNPKPSKKTEE